MIEKINKWLPIITLVVVLALALGMVGGNTSTVLGGSTSDNWGVGGNLTVTGTSAFTGGITAGAITTTGDVKATSLTQGGGVLSLASTTATDYTLTEAQLLASSLINIATSSANTALTLTLPATSTMTTLLPTAGQSRSWVIGWTGASTTLVTTITTGAGIDLQEPDDSSDFNVVIAGVASFVKLDCTRLASTDVMCIAMETTVAD